MFACLEYPDVLALAKVNYSCEILSLNELLFLLVFSNTPVKVCDNESITLCLSANSLSY